MSVLSAAVIQCRLESVLPELDDERNETVAHFIQTMLAEQEEHVPSVKIDMSPLREIIEDILDPFVGTTFDYLQLRHAADKIMEAYELCKQTGTLEAEE